MTERNLKKELSYWVHNDPEYGDDITNLDYPALIGLLTELMSRVETLERELEYQKDYAMEQDYRNNIGL